MATLVKTHAKTVTVNTTLSSFDNVLSFLRNNFKKIKFKIQSKSFDPSGNNPINDVLCFVKNPLTPKLLQLI